MVDGGRRVLLHQPIKITNLAELRRWVLDLATAAGLSRPRTEDFAVAVIEVANNVIRHGGGVGTLILWRDGQGPLIAEICDFGPGIPPGVTISLPAPAATSGRGLWMAQALADRMSILTGARGTTIRLEMTLG